MIIKTEPKTAEKHRYYLRIFSADMTSAGLDQCVLKAGDELVDVPFQELNKSRRFDDSGEGRAIRK